MCMSSYLLGERLTSLTITMSPTHTFRCGRNHFWCSWRLSRYSLHQQDQNSLARCCTRLQRLRAYMSAGSNCPGGDSRTLDFIVRRWLGTVVLGNLNQQAGWQWEDDYCFHFTHQSTEGFIIKLHCLTKGMRAHSVLSGSGAATHRPFHFESNPITLSSQKGLPWCSLGPSHSKLR